MFDQGGRRVVSNDMSGGLVDIIDDGLDGGIVIVVGGETGKEVDKVEIVEITDVPLGP